MGDVGGSPRLVVNARLAVAWSITACLAAAAAAGCSPQMLGPGGPGSGGSAGGASGGFSFGGATGEAIDAGTVGPVTGTFETADAVATISYPGGGGYLVLFADGTLTFLLGMPSLGLSAQVTFTSPPGAFTNEMEIALQVTGVLLGDHESAGGCGIVSVLYDTPSTFDAGCGPYTDAGVCPSGCGQITLPLAGSAPCYQPDPQFLYRALGTTACSLAGAGAGGSWSLSLTSMGAASDLNGAPVGNGIYVVHGTLTAVLLGGSSGDGGPGALSPGKLWMEF